MSTQVYGMTYKIVKLLEIRAESWEKIQMAAYWEIKSDEFYYKILQTFS